MKISKSNFIRRLHSRSVILRVLGLSMIVVSFAVFVYFTRKQEKAIEKQNEAIETQNIEIEKKDTALTEIQGSKNRVDTLSGVVNEYLKLRAEHDPDALDNLYSDRLDFYFINIRNAEKEKVRVADKEYWRKYPNDKFIQTDSPEILISNKTAQAIVKGTECRTENSCVSEI